MSVNENGVQGKEEQLAAASMRQALPPQCIEAEVKILCSCFLLPQVVPDIVYSLSPDAFYVTANKLIYESICFLYQQGQPTDMIHVAEHLRGRKLLQTVGDTPALCNIMSDLPTTEIVPYVKLVTDKWIRRKLIAHAYEIMSMGYEVNEPLEGILNTSEQKIFSLSLLSPADSTVHNAFVANAAHAKLLEQSRIFKTGLNRLDDLIISLEADTLTVLAGRPSMGKTAIGLALSLKQVFIHKKPVIYFSLEMTREQLEYRLWSLIAADPRYTEYNLTPVTGHRIRQHLSGQIPFSQAEYDNLCMVSALSMDVSLYINDRRDISPQGIIAEARRVKAKEKDLGLVVVDYIQLLQSDGHSDYGDSAGKSLELAKIARSLYQLAKELECPVLVLSQLNRNVESRNDKRPTMSDLAQSGAIEWIADNVLLAYRDKYYNPNGNDDLEIIVAKARHGKTGKASVGFHLPTQLIYNLDDPLPPVLQHFVD